MSARRVVDVEGFDGLCRELQARGWQVIAPTLRDGCVTYAPISGIADLPAGVGDTQVPGRYRTTPRADQALFGYAAPVQSVKPVFFPARELLLRVRTTEPANPQIEPAPTAERPVALLGLRSCDLAALAQHDHILTERAAVDVHYAARRADTVVIAVACSDPAATCFCASLGTGPAPSGDFDIALTEVLDKDGHRFVADVGSDRGRDLLDAVGAGRAGERDLAAAERVVAHATAAMTRHVESDDLVGILFSSVESAVWDEVADRCLACTNCTLVCPTCFCSTIDDVSDLTSEHAERCRVWASCFTKEYSYIHGGSVRESTRSRYRQWLTHKFAAWQVQFGSVGCVGCGRCIAWCPAGIDVTEEIAALRDGDARHPTREGTR